MYIINQFVPYEGESEIFRANSEDELVQWFKDHEDSFNLRWSLYDFTIYRTDCPDSYELMERARKLV